LLPRHFEANKIAYYDRNNLIEIVNDGSASNANEKEITAE